MIKKLTTLLIVFFLLIINIPIASAVPTSIDLWNTDTEVTRYEDVVFAATLIGGKYKDSVTFNVTRNNDSLVVFSGTDQTDKHGVALVQHTVDSGLVATNYTLTAYPTDYPYINDSVNITISPTDPDYIPSIRLSPYAVMGYDYCAIFIIHSKTKPEDNIPLNVSIIDPYTNETPCNRIVYTDEFGTTTECHYIDPAIFEVDKHYICDMEILNKSDLSDVIAHEYHAFLTVPSHDVTEYITSYAPAKTVFRVKPITEISVKDGNIVIDNNQDVQIEIYKNGIIKRVIDTSTDELFSPDKPYLSSDTYLVRAYRNGVLVDEEYVTVISYLDDLFNFILGKS